MILKYRLEIMMLCLAGFFFDQGNVIVYIIFYSLFAINLVMNVIYFKEITTNENRMNDLLRQASKTVKTKKIMFIKVFFWLTLIGLTILPILLQSMALMIAMFLTVSIEVIKLIIFKQARKRNQMIDQ